MTSHETFALKRLKEFLSLQGACIFYEDDKDMLWFIVRNGYNAPEGFKQTFTFAQELIGSLEKKGVIVRERDFVLDGPDMLSIS